jgi:signal peptidase I
VLTALWVCGVAAVVALAAGYARARLIVVTVTGNSMRPLIARGGRVLVRRTRRCRRGDLVLLRPAWGGRQMVKQVAAEAGDPVPGEFRVALAAATVPAGMLLVRGTTADSLDSRQLGPVPVDSVIGVVMGRRRAVRVPPVVPPCDAATP